MTLISSSSRVDDERILLSSMNNLSVVPDDPHSHDNLKIRHDTLTIVNYKEGKVDDYMQSQPEITAIMRSKVIDLLVDKHKDFKLCNRTLYLSVSIMDRFLAAEAIPKSELVSVGVTALLIASKFEEVRGSEIPNIEYLSVFFSRILKPQDFVAMEKRILARLKWRVDFPTSYFFLTMFFEANTTSSDTTMENMVYFYAELGLMNYKTIGFCPSMVAAAAVYASCATLKKRRMWHERFERQTGYKKKQVMDCAMMLVGFHSRAKRDTIRKIIFNKYSCDSRGAVALYPPAKSLLQVAKKTPTML